MNEVTERDTPNAATATNLKETIIIQPNCHKRLAFEGKTLVDKLLGHYSKFQDSRDRAVRYAQKLLDLGHIESVLPMPYPLVFNDTAQMYKWSNVEDVLRENGVRGDTPMPKKKSMSPIAKTRSQRFEKVIEIPHTASNGSSNGSNGIVKILIETDNCNGTEIQVIILINYKRNVAMAIYVSVSEQDSRHFEENWNKTVHLHLHLIVELGMISCRSNL